MGGKTHSKKFALSIRTIISFQYLDYLSFWENSSLANKNQIASESSKFNLVHSADFPASKPIVAKPVYKSF